MSRPVYIYNASSINPLHADKEKDWLNACEPDYKTIITNPTLRRRMSRLIKMGVACGIECLKDISSEEVDAIITATGLGCLADTEKFMRSIEDNGEKALNPTAFIQSTFNTIGGQIALFHGIHAYNVTYVHRGFSFESALLDACLRVKEGDRKVLVGAIDEVTETSFKIQKRVGLLRGVQAGEGANFFLIGNYDNEHGIAELVDIHTFRNPAEKESINHILYFLERNHITDSEINDLLIGANGNGTDNSYNHMRESLFKEAHCDTFKNECGEYHTASSYALWKMVNGWKEKEGAAYGLIYNRYQSSNHSLILVRKTYE